MRNLAEKALNEHGIKAVGEAFVKPLQGGMTHHYAEGMAYGEKFFVVVVVDGDKCIYEEHGKGHHVLEWEKPLRELV